jgi:small-conductance mechanosensitive channel
MPQSMRAVRQILRGFSDMQQFTIGGWIGVWAQQISEFIDSLVEILRALPGAPAAFFKTAQKVLTMPSGDRSVAVTLLLLALCVVLVFAPRALLRLWPLRPIYSANARHALMLQVMLSDGLDVIAALLVATLAAAVLFPGTAAIDQFAVALLWCVTRWRISMRGIDIFLRASRPDLRLVPVEDETARQVTFWAGLAFALALGFVTIVPVFLNHALPLLNARALAMVLSALDFLFAITAVRRLAEGLPGYQKRTVWFGVAGALTLWAIWVGSVAALDFTLYDAFTKTAMTLWIIVAIYCLAALATRSEDSVTETATRESSPDWLIGSAIRKVLLVASAAIGLSLVARDWLVEVFQMITPEQWPAIASASSLTLFVSVIGFLSYEALRIWSGVKFGPQRATLVPGLADEDDERHSGSRLATILPVLSRILLVSSLVLAALLGLANYGVNIGPLLAGAGIFGLAISFGSQALVRDIVSGFFFIMDDAFRVGEYIDTGRQKGTVERISIRSFRLRHQNGQVHTVPYGQLGAVTNFSRDWATIKFNLRLSRESDIEVVRKLAKKIGQAMLDDPEIGSEFLVPLKLQGVADILENALVMRFKFTVRPIKASLVQREAVKRLYVAFKDQGIKFATNAVFVINESGRLADAAAGAATQKIGMPMGLPGGEQTGSKGPV